MSQKPKNIRKIVRDAATLAFALDPEDGGQRRSLTSVKDGGTLTKWANVAKFIITTLEQGIKDSRNVGDSSLQTKLEEALARFHEANNHYNDFEFLRGALGTKGYDFSGAFQACEEQLNQDRRRFAETVEQSRNVPQGAALAGVAGAGAPPTPNVAPPVQAPTAGAPAPAAGANEDELKQLQLEVARLKVEDQKNQNNHNQRMNGFDITLREQQFQLGEQQGQINELTVQQMRDREQNQNQFTVVNERLNLTATKKDLQSLREELRRNEDGGLVGAALDFSDSSSDDESASSPRRAGVNAVTPMDKKTVKVSRETYDAFSSLLNRAVEYGQEGKETEMNACLKKAEDFMAKTDLAEERQRFHQRFKTGSSCARRLCSQYGLKPAAR